MYMLLLPFIVSAGVSGGLVLTKNWHGRFSLDTHEGAQKFHTAPTPRIGGVALFVAVIVGWLVSGHETAHLLGLMLLASLPAFIAGLLEDFTKNVGVKERLLATMLSGLFASVFTGYHINHLDVAGIDYLLTLYPIALAFTVFSVGGVANAINIIDGFNGLAGGVLMICFGVFGLIAWQVGDVTLVNLCLLFAFTIAGFMLVNFPFGKIFMGDGGAYLMGFLLAWTAVMLPMRNPEVSPWASIVVCAYPVIETIASMIRRILKKTYTGSPDSEHLHSLIKIKIIRRYFSNLPQHFRNALVSPFCWLFAFIFAFPAIIWHGHTPLLILAFTGCFIVYMAIYNLISAKK